MRDRAGRTAAAAASRTDPGVPCWAVARYAGPARRAVLALKERGRTDLAAPLGHAMAGALRRLRTPGVPLLLVPAPSRRAAARRRGGDPVVRTAAVAVRSLDGCQLVPVLRVWRGVQDSVGLSPGERRHNLRGRIWVSRAAPDAAPKAPLAEAPLHGQRAVEDLGGGGGGQLATVDQRIGIVGGDDGRVA
ncbi:ComF family protein, partial [Nocardia farcinica]|uniref:ComF family protein n=1 Tax=Nocardia farcinica TaxID=37329 RepID=UPI002457584D